MRSPTILRSWFDLLSSMRFAVSLLTILGIASIIGTVLKQNEPYPSYINQFGSFWFKIFESLGLYSVYSASWFLFILLFLVLSTSICIYRNGPQMIHELKNFREHARENSLRSFSHQAHYSTELASNQIYEKITHYLTLQGFKFKTNRNDAPATFLIAAKKGSFHRLGYLFAHGAIVLICIGGLLNGDLPLKFKLLIGSKEIQDSALPLNRIPSNGQLSPDHFSFRASTLIAENTSQDKAIINVANGILIQNLPFNISLKKFYIEHYSTGAPKLFASDVIITDKNLRHSFEARIQVNAPLIYQGIAIYQSGFDDGGSLLNLAGHNLNGNDMQEIKIRVGESVSLKNAPYTLELTNFRAFNVENTSQQSNQSKNFITVLKTNLGSAAPSQETKEIRNVGPSFQYKLRDASGQAREYHNYMLPIRLEERWFLISGMRETPNDVFRYIRWPMDENGSLKNYRLLRTALFDKSLYPKIAKRFAQQVALEKSMTKDFRLRFEESIERTLQIFTSGGFQAVANFLQSNVPANEREKTAEIYIKILQGATWEALKIARLQAKLPPLDLTLEQTQFIQDSLNALSDSFFYGAPIYLQLMDYDEVKASVFQVTRAPGKNILYFGFVLLISGIFAMLFIHENRLWLLVKQNGQVLLAMSTNRKTLDFEKAFSQHQKNVALLLKMDAPQASPVEHP